MIKALLCDFDGTIINTLWLYPKAYSRALKTFDIFLTEKEIVEQCFGKTEETICENLGIPEHVNEFKRIYFSACEEFSAKATLFSDVVKVLKSAKGMNIHLGVISFAYRWYIDRMLLTHALKDYFQIVLAYEDVENPKPAPDAVIKASSALKVLPEECLVIGDSKSDMIMGKAAGAKTALFFPKEHKKIYSFDQLKQTKPDYTIKSWNEVQQLFNTL